MPSEKEDDTKHMKVMTPAIYRRSRAHEQNALPLPPLPLPPRRLPQISNSRRFVDVRAAPRLGEELSDFSIGYPGESLRRDGM